MKTPRTGHQPPNRLLLLGALLALLPMLAAVDIPAKTGPFRSPGSPRTDLLNPKPIPAGLRSVGWLNGVGGVAFGAVAQPVPSSVQLKGITYLASAPDGQRLRVTVNSGGADEQVVAPLPDWQLIPIARFAAGDQHAVFTLFGEAATAAETDQLLADGYDILNYHPAFNDRGAGPELRGPRRVPVARRSFFWRLDHAVPGAPGPVGRWRAR